MKCLSWDSGTNAPGAVTLFSTTNPSHGKDALDSIIAVARYKSLEVADLRLATFIGPFGRHFGFRNFYQPPIRQTRGLLPPLGNTSQCQLDRLRFTAIQVTLDFNQAHNPLCACNHQFLCPIAPRENSALCTYPRRRTEIPGQSQLGQSESEFRLDLFVAQNIQRIR
jgi:uncharacterized protein DUF1684